MQPLSIRVGAAWNDGVPVGGKWLHGLVPYGALGFSTTLNRCTDNSGGGGLLTIEWAMAYPSGLPLPRQMRQDALVELYAGPWPLGAAVISETPDGTTVKADGLFRLGEAFLAVDPTGAPTTDVAVAVARAIDDGLRWRDPGTLPTGSLSTLSEDSAKFNTVTALLNAYCRVNGKVWWIDRWGYLQIGDLPTTVTLSLNPTVPMMETADDDYASAYFIRRVDSVDGDGQPNAWAPASATDPDAPMIREKSADLEQLGYLSPSAGTAAAQALLDANKSRASFTEGVAVGRGQVTTLGGVPPELWSIAAGDVARHSNWLTAGSDLRLADPQPWVVGGTTWKQGEQLVITPLGIAPRTVAQLTQYDQTSRNYRTLVFA